MLIEAYRQGVLICDFQHRVQTATHGFVARRAQQYPPDPKPPRVRRHKQPHHDPARAWLVPGLGATTSSPEHRHRRRATPRAPSARQPVPPPRRPAPAATATRRTGRPASAWDSHRRWRPSAGRRQGREGRLRFVGGSRPVLLSHGEFCTMPGFASLPLRWATPSPRRSNHAMPRTGSTVPSRDSGTYRTCPNGSILAH